MVPSNPSSTCNFHHKQCMYLLILPVRYSKQKMKCWQVKGKLNPRKTWLKGVSRGHPLPSTHIERRANSNQIGKSPQAEIPQIPRVPFPEFDCPHCGYKKKSLNRIFSCSLFLSPLIPSLCSPEARLHLFYSHIQLQKKALRNQISRQLFLLKAISLSIPLYIRCSKPLIILVPCSGRCFLYTREPQTLCLVSQSPAEGNNHFPRNAGWTLASRAQQAPGPPTTRAHCWLTFKPLIPHNPPRRSLHLVQLHGLFPAQLKNVTAALLNFCEVSFSQLVEVPQQHPHLPAYRWSPSNLVSLRIYQIHFAAIQAINEGINNDWPWYWSPNLSDWLVLQPTSYSTYPNHSSQILVMILWQPPWKTFLKWRPTFPLFTELVISL